MRGWFRRTGSEILGWIIVVVGVILMPLPGPGMVIVVSGLAILSRHYVWAQRLLGPLERKATEAAKFGVETWPRILVSFLGGAWLALGWAVGLLALQWSPGGGYLVASDGLGLSYTAGCLGVIVLCVALRPRVEQ